MPYSRLASRATLQMRPCHSVYVVRLGQERLMNMRKRTDLEVKFDTFMANHWLHMVRDVANLQGQLKILIGMVGGLAAFVVGVWAVEVLK
jgi:hypothetical protein